MIILTIEPSRAPSRVRAKSLSASEVEVSWKPLPWSTSRTRIMGYEVRTTQLKQANESDWVCSTSPCKYIPCAVITILASSFVNVLNAVTTNKQCYKNEYVGGNRRSVGKTDLNVFTQ